MWTSKRFLLCAVLTLTLNALSSEAADCPAPPALAFMSVSSNGTTSGSLATYTCLPGFALNDSNPVTLTCNANGAWEGLTNVACLPADCGEPPAVDNATVSYNSTTYPNEAVYECDEGLVDAENDVKITCSADGGWTTPTVDCQPADCGEPPTILNAFTNHTSGDTGYLSQAFYQCYSGHTYDGGADQMTFTCQVKNGKAKWNGFVDTETSCKKLGTYAGCFPADLTSQGQYGRSNCKGLCLAQNLQYAALKGGECACLESLTSLTAVDDAKCNASCGDMLCGGEPDMWSIYTTFHGCFQAMDLAGSVLAYNELTCREYCRGLDFRFSAFNLGLKKCLCLNQTVAGLTEAKQSLCAQANETAYTDVTTIELENTVADTCEGLFERGIHISSYYYLTGATLPVMCHFYDGTMCDSPYWVGFNGSCYMWNLASGNYSQAASYCTDNDALLFTLHTQEEADFMKLALTSIGTFSEILYWHLGLYDNFGVFSRQWSDGALFTYSGFVPQEPNEMSKKCTITSKHIYWYDEDCGELRPSICERPKGVYGCVTTPASDITAEYSFSDPDLMSLTLCFETCRGQGVMYAAVSGSTCYCLSSLPVTHANVSWSQCASSACPGNQFQLCGNPTTSPLTLFVLQDNDQPRASSCLDLELQGITGVNVTVYRNGVTETVNCTRTEVTCPYSWGNVNGRCYKFFPTTKLHPYRICGTHFQSYPVVLNSAYELEAVFNDTSSMQGSTRWTVGLFKYQSKGVFRTSSGQPMADLPLPTSTDTYQCVSYDVTTGLLAESACTAETFVCEQGPEYQGCALVSPGDVLILDDYVEMNIMQCVELCRGQGALYALLGNNPYRCYCSNQVNKTAEDCNVFCYGDVGQLCGGADYSIVSAYSVEAYPVFANSCADLFNEGVLLPGTYIIKDQPVWCTMKDNTSCTVADQSQWVTVGLNGACFKLALSAQTDPLSKCKTIDHLHKPASVRSQQELELLFTTYWSLKSAYLLSTVVVGAKDEFRLGAFTWADGSLFDFAAWMTSHPILNLERQGWNYAKYSTDTLLYNRASGGTNDKILCREVHDYLGCYTPNMFFFTAPVIANCSSMGVTLCKQTCLGQNKSRAVLDEENCYCLDSAEMSVLSAVDETEAGCDVPCPANDLQSCASDGKLRVYSVDTSDVATNCSTLHANFVVLENTYMLRNNDTGENEWHTCGFADKTQCGAGYVGHNGKCYRFFPFTDLTAEEGADFCATYGGYLATPRDQEEVTFIIRAIESIPSLSTFSQWRLGVLDLMPGDYQASSDGSLMRSEMWNGNRNSAQTECSSLDAGTGSWNKSLCNTTLPFVCETSSVFLGCMTFTSGIMAIATFDLASTSSTVQQCVTLCSAQDARYALVTQTSCSCVVYDTYQASSRSVVTCPAQCGDAFSQICGDESTSVFAVYDIAAYSMEDKTVRSCPDYRQYLVTASGRYDLYVDSTSTMRVQCGDLGSKHGDILEADSLSALFTASSSVTTAVNARLQPEQIWWSTWKREESDPDPWVQVTLSDYFLIKAVSITGGAGLTENGYVTSFTISHGLFATGMTSYVDTFSGPSTELVATRFIPEPFVAKVIKIHPELWTGDPYLSFTLLGERYGHFDHSDWYVGCFADPQGDLMSSYQWTASFEDCKTHCHDQRYPFFGLATGGANVCACASAVGKYGLLDDDSCNATCLSSTCGSDVTKSVAIYRTYEKRCPEPPFVANTTNSTNYLVTWPGVYTFGTNITYTCLTGHEFPDLSTVASITCLQNNTWSPVAYTSCEIIQCDPPANISNGLIVSQSGVNFGDHVSYICHNNFETETGASTAVSYCSASKTWNPPAPVCAAQRSYRSRMGCKDKLHHSLSGSSVVDLQARSLADCARFCMLDAACSVYSFPSNMATLPAGEHNCRMHLGLLTSPLYVTDAGWDVFSLGKTCD